ncbi:MAG: hypothetical protein MJ247_04630 [Alphaproteobacteria bacterium]|nr:hypothetical protein [Alphaproteobacteria bacterium]
MSSELNSIFEKKHKPGNRGNNHEEIKKADIPFKIRTKNPKNVNRMVGIINTIAQNSPFGKAVLQEACDNGYSLAFEAQEESCGFCDPENKAIVLNPSMDNDLLIATLAHEARHAQQFVRGATQEFGKYNLKSELMYTRATEADAETAACATCHEIRVNSGIDGPWNAFAEDSEEIAMGFVNATEDVNQPVNDNMLRAAFNGWYKATDMVEAYEESYIQDTMKSATKYKEEGEYPYSDSITSAEIVKCFCSNAKGECFWNNNLNVLEEPEKVAMSAATFDAADKYNKIRENRYGTPKDDSYLDLPVRDPQNLSKDSRYKGTKTAGNDNSAFKKKLNAMIAAKKQR